MKKELSILSFIYNIGKIISNVDYEPDFNKQISILEKQIPLLKAEIKNKERQKKDRHFEALNEHIEIIKNKINKIKEYLPKIKEFEYPNPEIYYNAFKIIYNKETDILIKNYASKKLNFKNKNKYKVLKKWLNDALNDFEKTIYKIEFLERLDLFTENKFYIENRQIIYIWIHDNLETLKYKYNIEKTNIKQKSKTTSFNFTGTKNQLKKLHKELLNGNFIAKETDYKDFEAVFSNVSIENIKPIKWIDIVKTSKQQANIQTVYELLFLLKSNDLLENKFCTTRNNINNLYKKIDNCFTDGIKEVRFNHIGKKNPDRYSYKPKQNTEKKILLNTIIQSL